MGNPLDLKGKKFNRLKLLFKTKIRRNTGVVWVCRCDCGMLKYLIGSQVANGMVKSCGCLQKEQLAKASTSHGLSQTNFYERWSSMVYRCGTGKHKDYEKRGIRVCRRWLKFENFRDDMYKSYLAFRKHHQEYQTTLERL